jgi:hypothetical protein
MSQSVRILTLTLALAAPACAYRVYSPPARSLPLEAPRPTAPGHTSVTGEAAVHSLLFGPTVSGGDLRVSRGTAHGAVSVEGTVLSVSGDSAAKTTPIIAAARAGYRTGDRSFGFGVGLGGGYSAGGVFVSPDFTVTVGYENCYVVPFASLRSAVSLPLAPSAVDVSKREDGPGAHVLTPRLTGMLTPGVGVTIPIVRRCGQWPASRAELSLGVAWTILADGQQADTYFGVGSGVTVHF